MSKTDFRKQNLIPKLFLINLKYAKIPSKILF